jgi:type I restriction-modification system DNA methylase subunit/REP element-mobilizing transposase RayT
MTAEEQISRGFVDFGFYLDGVPRFYLETKKIPEDLDRPEWARQAINYAWLKGVTWAVLTDFEGLKILNAEWNESNPAQAVLLDLKVHEYADGRFDDLWLLSKDAIRAGEIDRVAERFGKKAKRRKVNETLLAQLTIWRRELFKQITQWGDTLWTQNPREMDNAVQRLIDRLIFVRTVEDREIEPPRLRAVLRQFDASRQKGKNLFADLQALFRELDRVYNATLFAESAIDHISLYDPDLLKTIINGLYDVPRQYASYDFNAIDADVLGAVYEQYLGFKAQDPTGKDAIELDKRQKRKAQGIYYTPQFVVRYIVQNTLGRLLEEGRDPHTIRVLDPACGSGSFLIEAFDTLDRWLAQREPDVPPRERRRRILDENLYGVDLDEQAVEVARLNLLLRAADARERLPMLTHIRRGNSLIDDPAVVGDAAFRWEDEFLEVFAGRTRALWFVTFVTHNARVSERMVTYGVEHGEPLVFSPEDQLLIAEKIAEACRHHAIPVVAWNVLPDHVHLVLAAQDDTALSEAVRKIKGYSSHAFQRARNWESGQHVWAQKFDRRLITDESMLGDVVDYVMNNHLKHLERWGMALVETWERGVPGGGDDISSSPSSTPNKGLKPLVRGTSGERPAGEGPSSRPLSDIVSELCVSPEEAVRVRGGFDVVIGNPPYGAKFSGKEFEYFRDSYGESIGTYDSYEIFLLKSAHLLKKEGLIGMIIPSSWLTGASYKASRKQLLERLSPTVAYAMPFDVFPSAYIDTAIVGFSGTVEGPQVCLIHYFPKKTKLFEIPSNIGTSVPVERIRADDERRFSAMFSNEYSPMINKLESCPTRFGDRFDIQRGVQPYSRQKHTEQQIQSRFLHANFRASGIHLPELQGSELGRYYIAPDRETYLEYSDRLASIRDLRMFQGERIVLRRLLTRRFRLQASFCTETMITTDNVLNLVPKESETSVRYSLGILNSKLISWFYVGSSMIAQKDDFPQVHISALRDLPIPTPDTGRHDRMVELVQQMLDLQREHVAAEAALDDRRHILAEKIAQLDRLIDALVYDLYGLTDEEIAIVEGRA